MARSDRLLQLMQSLRSSHPPVRAGDLAQDLNISQRSVYRDIETLRASGAIIDGEAGYGYTLVEDPALPPMMFSRDEMEALVLGLREVREVGDPVLAAAAADALSKVKACLPQRMRSEFDHAVLHAKRFHERPEITIDVSDLRVAAREETAVDIDYRDFQGRDSQRRVLPLAIVFMERTLVLLAWCTVRRGFRVFRIDRIRSLQLTQDSFRPRRVAMLREFLMQMEQEAREARQEQEADQTDQSI